MNIIVPDEKTPEERQGKPASGLLGLLRRAAQVAVVVGAVGSVALMLRAGHRNPSRFLLVLFVGWVLCPFVGLAVASALSRHWAVLTRAVLHTVMGVLALGSLAIYGTVVFGPPRPTPAFMFLVVPAGSWLLITITVPLAAFISGRRSRHAAGA